ncbi:hypothetical protein CWB96_06195 [Pseudoalteromonas citrea]|uniref:Uncharacterized protein n=1 Tax=Pseudoalteromonas citrea TaxID=43655 RepID=A0A5S3XRM6_9GAMM|nr:hypothetical protein [Pseudoalteromonas citrea]TMP41779.1 hypothetical protein CWB97_13505 [Pseudoalteromonas citrea]TMP60556.1 hypothetical protein CWB96_06195 [Pseudoalteromonas citrea]
MEIQCDAIRVKAKLSEKSGSEQTNEAGGHQASCTTGDTVAQLEKSLKRYVDRQFQQFIKQRRP